MAKTVVIGLMGGMYSGKSTVASEFGRLGCAVIDGDEIAHELLGENSIKNEIVTEFGKGILGRQSEIDRQKLAVIVFGDGEKLQILCEILHPRVTERTKGLIAEYRGQGVPAVVLDMPLLVEAGLEKLCDMLVFVDCERPLRLERAVKRWFLMKIR
jgi:dephospho-CoA kinase